MSGCTCQDARLDQLRRKYGEVCTRIRSRSNLPDRAKVPLTLINPRNPSTKPCLGIVVPRSLLHPTIVAGHRSDFHSHWIVEVPTRLGQQEDIFVGCSRTIGHVLGERIRLLPDHILAQIPTCPLKSEGHPPGDAHEVFGLETNIRGIHGSPPLFDPLALLIAYLARDIGPVAMPPSLSVAIPQDQPSGSVAAKHPPNPLENLHQFRDILLGSGFETKLPLAPVIPKAPVRRRGNHTMD